MDNQNSKLKAALLSTSLIAASLNAITGMIPEMAKAFPHLPLSSIELVATIPSLFQMLGILCGKPVSSRIGHKYTMLLGLICCTIGGVLPVFFPKFEVILVTRCLFGIGCGFQMSSILALIIHFFSGRSQSAMIGLNGGISGIGSALSTFVAGQLLVLGWSKTFCVYFFGLIVIFFFLFAVPNTKAEPSAARRASGSAKNRVSPGLVGFGVLMFVSVALATFYVIKATTLITERGFGTAADGSLSITFLSLGSFAAGLTYGRIRAKLGKRSLALFFFICAVGNLIGFFATGKAAVWIGAFFLGYGYLGFMPYIQDEAARRYRALGDAATNLILIFQSAGAFITPYIFPALNWISNELRAHFLIVAVLFAGLATVDAVLSCIGASCRQAKD